MRRIGGDVPLFRAATALAILFMLDDAFVHPEPGVSAADHVSSGLVPSGALVALALVYPLMRPGLRAISALCVGALAVTASASDGFHHVLVDRLSGDDATAMLAGLAGAGLLGLGAAILWRTRRREERRVRRYAIRIVETAAVGFAALMVLAPIGVAIIATHKARTPIAAADLGAPHQRVSFTTSDGLRLAGWYVPSRTGAAVIAFPGRRGPVPHARMLVRHGYGVLLFDRRGEGESQGDLNLFGWNGSDDLEAAVAFLRRQPDVDPARIGGLGLSVGGELLLEAAARIPALRAVVSEGAGARSLAEHLHDPGPSRVQRWVTPWLAQTAALAILSNQGPPDDLVDLMPRIAPRSVLLIRSLDGQRAEALNRTYHAAAREPKSLWEISEGGHTGGLSAVPREYERRVIGFFDEALSRRVPG
jgi:dienelactone hydrolase